MDYLQGGRKNQITRITNTVHRPSGFWTKSVHALLTHLQKSGFTAAPLPLGFDDKGNEIVTFMPGEVCNYPLNENASSLEALISAALLLRAYHNATVPFLNQNKEPQSWLLPTQNPPEVICHGDFAPYNVVLNGRQAIAIIDFDTAHPGPRIWDIAYALYRWSPLKNPNNPDSLGSLDTQIGRARRFCDAYGLPFTKRRQLVTTLIERLRHLIHHMYTEAEKGNPTFQAHLIEGHHLRYTADITYLQQNQAQIQFGLEY